jgi:outer membrane lipoprotein LolB
MKLTPCWIFRIVIPCSIFLLTACTTVSKPKAVDNPDLEWSERQTRLNKISNWKINGRLAITNEAEVWHLSVIWKQQDQRYKIHLSGPFGAGAVQLTGDQTGVTIVSGNETTHARNAEQLLFETTGVQIPIHNLFYWVRGLPNPESDNSGSKIDPYGRLSNLSQNNWHIRFKRYSNVSNIDLPSKIFIKQDSLDIRFVIEDWSLSG